MPTTADEAAAAHEQPLPALSKGGGGGGFHYVVVGAGLSGAVLAREAAEAGRKALVIDKREHIAGNCYDYIDHNGYRVAQYGPHFFHTRNERVWAYVQRFSHWSPWEHRVTARLRKPSTGAEVHVPVPANIATVNELFDLSIGSEEEMNAWLGAEQVPCAAPGDSRDVALSRVGHRLYDLLFRGYTKKQWDKFPEQLEPSVLARIPVRSNWDDRYFTDPHQALPTGGYTAFVAAILDHPNIEVRTGCDFFAERHALASAERVIYTGPVDHYFAHLGYEPLEYRSVRFVPEDVPIRRHDECVQPTSQVNYPSLDVPWTRVTEYKHLLGQTSRNDRLTSTLLKEYSSAEGDPFYPVPDPKNRALYEKYRAAAEAEPRVMFAGRLASYKYFNMDEAINSALTTADDAFRGGKPA